MFTGIVEETGIVERIKPTARAIELTLRVGICGRGIKVGDCLVNEGTDDDADMRKVTCTSGAYEVLKRFDGTSDKTKCSGVTASTHTFTHTSSIDSSSSFVLCMKQRS